jgi:uncharacterized membrane protein
MRVPTGLAFITMGVLHFTHTRLFKRIMPPYLPMHREAVLVSGAAEIAGGVGVLVPAARPYARWWLIALLTAVFPANVHMALEPEDYKEVPAWALWARLPFQVVFGWAVWRATEPSGSAPSHKS